MKIVRQLAQWLLESDRITPEYYREVLLAIQGEIGEGDKKLLFRTDRRQEGAGSDEDAIETWWNLRGAGTRTKLSRCKGGRKASPGTKPIKVVDLDPLLPDMLLSPGTALDFFPLAELLIAVDNARGNRRSSDWTGFAAAATSLYKIDAEGLHDAFLAAMKIHGLKLGKVLAAAEMGATLFPDGFLADFSGESIDVLRTRIDGEETDYSVNRLNWILHYPSCNIVNEACLVRNRLRRIYRLWVKNFAEDDVGGAASHGKAGICLAFGKTLVPVPVGVWWKLQDPAAPRLGSVRGLKVFHETKPWLNVSVDGRTTVFYESGCVDPPDPPCKFGWIEGGEPDEQSTPVHVVWPIVGPDERVPEISPVDPGWTDVTRWSPGTWAIAMVRGFKLSTGVPVENVCPWHFLHLWLLADYWVDLFLKRPDLVGEFPWKEIDPRSITTSKWRELLLAHPEFAEDAPWDRFDASDLCVLFSKCPVLAERCNCNVMYSSDLIITLEMKPDCVEACLRRLSNGVRWLDILKKHPEWAKYCQWQLLSPWDKVTILRNHPEFVDCCDFGGLGGFEWRLILYDQPQLADRCDWRKLDDNDWATLLSVQPQLSSFRQDSTQ